MCLPTPITHRAGGVKGHLADWHLMDFHTLHIYLRRTSAASPSVVKQAVVKQDKDAVQFPVDAGSKGKRTFLSLRLSQSLSIAK